MKPLHYLVIILAIGLTCLLYFGGNTVAPKEAHDHDHGPVAAGEPMMAPVIPAAKFDSLLVAAQKKLAPQVQAELTQLEGSITRGNVLEQQIKAYEAMGLLWQKQKNPGIAGYYFAKSGKLEKSEKKLNFAAHLQTEAIRAEQNPNVRQWMAEQAIDAYNASIALNPDNDTTRIDLAGIYIEATGETMKGIEQLLTVVRKNPQHIPANVILGRMAVESGQLDKAIERGNTILSLDKNNLEAHLFLGEAYKRNGEADKAKQMFNDAKKILNNPDFDKDIDEYMKTF